MRNIETIEDFNEIISEIQCGRMPFIGEQYQELYRGQSKQSYELKSGIARYIKSADELIKLEKGLIEKFKEIINSSNDTKKFIQLADCDTYENDWRWLEQMQHYRIPTRLLDWSLDPKIALFFATERNFDDDGQFWVFKSPLNWSCDDHFETNPYSDNLNIISNSSFYVEDDYLDKIAEERRSFQSGKFTIQDYNKSLVPLEQQEEINARFIKYIIPAEKKKFFLEYLKNYNISEESVYVKHDDIIENLVEKVKSANNI